MLRSKLIYILAALAGTGHGSQVLIADGNYPFTTGALATYNGCISISFAATTGSLRLL